MPVDMSHMVIENVPIKYNILRPQLSTRIPEITVKTILRVAKIIFGITGFLPFFEKISDE